MVVELTEAQRDLLAKQDLLESVFSNFHSEVDENRKFYNRDFKERIVPDRWRAKIEPLIPETAQHGIDEAVDHILFTPRIKVMVRPSEPERQVAEQDIAENKRQFLAALWNQEAIIHDARKTLISEGMVAIKKVINWHYIPKNPGRGAGRNAVARYRRDIAKLGLDKKPWSFEIIDNKTLTYGPVSNHRDPEYVYLKMEITVEQARALRPKPSDPAPGVGNDGPTGQVQAWRDKSDLETVEYIEYWSRDICDMDGNVTTPGTFMQIVDKEILHDDINPYPYIPIAIEDAGFGTIRNTAKPEEIFVGMTAGMRETFIAHARQLTALQAVAELTAFGLYTARNRDPSKKWNLGPGEIMDLDGGPDEPDREMFEVVQLPEVPQSVLLLIKETTRMANNVLKMETLGGQPLSGVETATEADQQIRNASAKLQSPVAALERLVARLSSWVLMDIELVLEAPVTIWSVPKYEGDPSSVTVKPSDIRGYYMVSAELRTTDQEAVNMVKARFWSELYRAIPFLSAWTAMEKGEISDAPSKEMVRRASEDIFNSPQMQMVRTMTAMQSFGELAAFLQQMGAMGGEGGAAGMGGPGGGAGAPGSPPTPNSGGPQTNVGPSLPFGEGMIGASVPAATPGGAGSMRDLLQGPAMIRGPRGT